MTERPSWTIIHSLDEIPQFASERDEHEYWKTHTMSDELLAQPVEDDLPTTRPRQRTIALRLSDDTIARAKAVAARRHIGYQTLIKEFITERLYDEEKRVGLRPISE
jgi:predicted DNA binding CopG/RHH family protein